MFVFGHVGIGRALLTRWIDRLPAIPLAIGTLLPDLIDKPLYYSRAWDFVSCTRTFGHTGILLLALIGAVYALRSRALAALSAGVATHLLLDCAFDWPPGDQSSAWTALMWPFYSRDFATFYFASMGTHAARLWVSPTTLGGEVMGLTLLGWELWRRVGRPAPGGSQAGT